MGGAFGGKVTRPCQIAAGAALAAWNMRRKVHLAVTRDDDLRMNGGKRCLEAYIENHQCLRPNMLLDLLLNASKYSRNPFTGMHKR